MLRRPSPDFSALSDIREGDTKGKCLAAQIVGPGGNDAAETKKDKEGGF